MKIKPLPHSPFIRPAGIEQIREETRPRLPDEDGIDLLLNKPEQIPDPIIAYDEEDEQDDQLPDEEEAYEYDNSGAFIIRTGEDWQRDDNDTPGSAMLFGNFWYRDELCILFADTNVGKSVLAVQIADSISRGNSIGHLQMDAPAVPVLYFDFELSDQQFRHRYSSPGEGKYPFTKNFCRATLNPFSNKQNKFNTYEEFINNEIENALLAFRAKVLIIDNITCLRYETQAAAGAQNLMHYLQNIKRRYQISILVLAHTPRRNTTKPLSRNDLQGSKMLINFADSAFAIGESQQSPGQRYLKQIKQRSSAEEYGAANVCKASIVKTGNFLHFQFGSQGYETDHLTPYTEQYRKNTQTRIAQLNRQGNTIRQIAQHLGLATTTVFRTLKRLGECEERCADSECADVQMNGNTREPQPFILNDSEGFSPGEPADKSAPGITLTNPAPQMNAGAQNAILGKSAPGVILQQARPDFIAGNNECKVHKDAITEHNKNDFTPPLPNPAPPPRFETTIQVSGNNSALYKQYQKELAMLKADDLANERRRRKAEKT